MPSGVVATYAWDNDSELTGITYAKSGTTVGTLTYTYNNLGQRSGQGGTLSQVWIPGTVYPADYNNANQILDWGGTSGYIFTHNPNGSVTEVDVSVYTNTLTWDDRNRLVHFTHNANVPTADYSYDALDRRINKKAYDNYGTLTKDINILYDGWQEVQELSGTTPTANLLTGPGLDEIFRRTTTAANTQNPSVTNDYLTDALHSTMALTDGTGAIQTTYTYQPYGGTGVYGTATDNPYQFTGRENDQNGLMYFRNRYLTTIGQFASEDPMGFGAGQNMYGYAGGNPVMFGDPSGLDWQGTAGDFLVEGGTIGVETGVLVTLAGQGEIGGAIVIAGAASVITGVILKGYDDTNEINSDLDAINNAQETVNKAKDQQNSQQQQIDQIDKQLDKQNKEGSGGGGGGANKKTKCPKTPSYSSPPPTTCYFVPLANGGTMVVCPNFY